MQELINQLITTATGLTLLLGSWFVHFLTGLSKYLFNDKKWDWGKFFRSLVKAGLMSAATLAWVAITYGIDWFATKCGADISALMEGASTAGVIGAIIGGSVYFLGKAFKNIIGFLNSGTEAPVGTIDYGAIADKVYEVADMFRSENEVQTAEDAVPTKEQLEKVEVGLGAASPLARRLPDGDTDGGKGWQAHPEGSLINMWGGGYKAVEDLEIGDELISNDGRKTLVKEKWSNEYPVYKIETRQGNYLYTPEHPLLTQDGFKRVKDITTHDKLVAYTDEISEDKTGLTDSELLLLGFWLGDGYADHGKYGDKYCVVVNDDKKNWLDTITDGITWTRHSNGKAWMGYIRKGKGVEDNSNSKKPSRLYDLISMCGDYSYAKDVAFETSLRERQLILDGYLKADGNEHHNGWTISTTSKRLALFVQKTAWESGKSSKISLVRKAGEKTNFGIRKHDLYHVSINKNNKFVDNGMFQITKIIKVSDNARCWHIEVDGDHTYVAENIKVHNCSKYSLYLATGICMDYAPHPDYGPCNGRDMVDYLVNNYGYVRCGKEAGAIFATSGGDYGHTGMVLDPATNLVNHANYAPLTVSTNYYDLDANNAVYCKPKDYVEPEQPKPEVKPVKTSIKVGDKVVPTKLVDYSGTPLIQWDENYTVVEISGDRAVLMARGAIWAAMNIKNIKKG